MKSTVFTLTAALGLLFSVSGFCQTTENKDAKPAVRQAPPARTEQPARTRVEERSAADKRRCVNKKESVAAGEVKPVQQRRKSPR